MKLYEFTYTDNLGQSEGQVLARVAEFLESEEGPQGWAEGYTFRQCRGPEHLPNGERRYLFEVLGEFETGTGDGGESATPAAAATPQGVAASSEQDAATR
jgi:hypothetical protein